MRQLTYQAGLFPWKFCL